MKVLLKIVAVILIGIGVIILIGGIYALVTNPSDITACIIVLVIACGFVFCGIKLWRKGNKISKAPYKSKQRNLPPVAVPIGKAPCKSKHRNLSKAISLFLKDYEKGNCSWKEFVNDNPINKTKANEKALKRFGLSLYKITLSKTLKDLCFSDVEQWELDEIAKCFSLTENETVTIKSSFADEATRRLVERKLSDKIITDDEKKELYIFGAALGMRQFDVDKIINNAAMDIYREYTANISADNRITPEEETELKELAGKLQLGSEQISELLDSKTKENLLYYKLLYEVEHDRLPVIEPPVIVQKNEVCHFSVSAQKLVTKTLTRHYGSSVRVGKTSVRLYSSHPIQEQVEHTYPGTLTITNKRVVFTATEKSFSIPLSKVANLIPYKDGVGIQSGQTTHLLQFGSNCTELVGTLIQAAIQKL